MYRTLARVFRTWTLSGALQRAAGGTARTFGAGRALLATVALGLLCVGVCSAWRGPALSAARDAAQARCKDATFNGQSDSLPSARAFTASYAAFTTRDAGFTAANGCFTTQDVSFTTEDVWRRHDDESGQNGGVRLAYAAGPAIGLAGQASKQLVLCQALGPAAPCNICAVDCANCSHLRRRGWENARAIAWQAFAQGEYVGHARTAHVSEYRLRVDDELDVIYRLTRQEMSAPYRLSVGDEIRVESFADAELNRDLIVQPDGNITLRLLGQIRAAGRTVPQLRDELEEAYKKYYKVPAITVTPLRVNMKLEDLMAAVDRRSGMGGQTQAVRVTPEGTIALPVIGSVMVQGLTLPELQEELNQRYRARVEGVEVIPILVKRAPRYVYVLGEVYNPGRYEMTGPTTILQAISMAGSWKVGAHLRQIVVFRRGDDWRLMATMVNLDAALHGRQPCPPGEIWLSDSDVVIVPKSPILKADEFIEMVFTRGIYGVLPLSATLNFSKLSSL